MSEHYYAAFHYGSNYTEPDVHETGRDVELFDTIADIKRALDDRKNNGSWRQQTKRFADGRVESDFMPNVGDDAEVTVWFYDPREVHDPYPDRLVKIGPRGGIRVERT